MDLHIGLVVELAGQDRARGVSGDFGGAGISAGYTFGGWGEDELGAEGAKHGATLLGEALGRVMITLYPLAAPTHASAIPVLPEVPSTMVPPGCSEPSASAASMMATPIRSFTELAGL